MSDKRHITPVPGAGAGLVDEDAERIGPDGLVADEQPETDELLGDDWIALSDPDMSGLELQLVEAALGGSRLTHGPMVARFEDSFAQWLGRKHAVSVSSGTLGVLLALAGLGLAGCSAEHYRESADRAAYAAIAGKSFGAKPAQGKEAAFRLLNLRACFPADYRLKITDDPRVGMCSQH